MSVRGITEIRRRLWHFRFFFFFTFFTRNKKQITDTVTILYSNRTNTSTESLPSSCPSPARICHRVFFRRCDVCAACATTAAAADGSRERQPWSGRREKRKQKSRAASAPEYNPHWRQRGRGFGSFGKARRRRHPIRTYFLYLFEILLGLPLKELILNLMPDIYLTKSVCVTEKLFPPISSKSTETRRDL